MRKILAYQILGGRMFHSHSDAKREADKLVAEQLNKVVLLLHKADGKVQGLKEIIMANLGEFHSLVILENDTKSWADDTED